MQHSTIVFFFLLISTFATSQVEWGYSIGGAEWEIPMDICTDSQNNVYIVGRYKGYVDFDPSQNELVDSSTHNDIFIQKMSPGRELIWTKFIKGNSLSQVVSINCDDKYLYLSGGFSKTVDFDPGPEESILESNIYGDIVILKLTLNGEFKWVERLKSDGYSPNDSYGIDLDKFGNIYITGYYTCPVDFDTGPDSNYVQLHPATTMFNSDGFISKFDSSGNLQWVSTINGAGNDIGTSIATDSNGYSYITGHIHGSVNFISGSSDTTEVNTPNPNEFEFLAKYDPDGNLIWVNILERAYYRIDDIKLSSNGNIYMMAYDYYQDDLYMMKVSSEGNLIWEKRIHFVNGYCLDIDQNENIYISGSFSGTYDFDPDPVGNFELSTSFMSDRDVFILKLDSEGNFVWATRFGDTELDYEPYITLSPDGHLYLAASFELQPNFEPDFWTGSVISNGSKDIIVLKMDTDFNNESNEECNQFQITPNLTSGNVTVHNHFGNLTEVDIYDLSGRYIYQNHIGLTSVNINFSSFTQGLYIIRAKTSTCEKTIKIVKN